MTRLVALRCPACQAALGGADVDGRVARVFCCPQCATGLDLPHAGPPVPYPVRCGQATAPAERGLYWELAGEARVVTFAATEPAKTALVTVAAADERFPFALVVPADAATLAACYERARARVGQRFAEAPFAAAPAVGTLGRREAERVAHQVLVSLLTEAPGKLHQLELALAVQTCSLVRAV